MPSSYPLKARSHKGDAWGTHGQRIGNLQFGPVRGRSLGVRHHSLLVRRARWTHAMHSSSFAVCVGIFWACSEVCAELDAWMYTPKARQTCVERARPASDIRGAHALYTHSALATRCAFCVSSLAFPKIMTKVRHTAFSDFQCAGRASSMCDHLCWERGACVDHSSSALATRCAFVEVVIMCVLCTVCMRTVHAPCMRSAR